jgi:hypothetical protein
MFRMFEMNDWRMELRFFLIVLSVVLILTKRRGTQEITLIVFIFPEENGAVSIDSFYSLIVIHNASHHKILYLQSYFASIASIAFSCRLEFTLTEQFTPQVTTYNNAATKLNTHITIKPKRRGRTKRFRFIHSLIHSLPIPIAR